MAPEPLAVVENPVEWTFYVNEKLKQMPLDEQPTWKKRCVYRVPACVVTDLNIKAYRPQVVSFGPYHHGEEHLRLMEEHKERALFRILKRSQKPIERFLESLREVARDLAESYERLDFKWKEFSGDGVADRFLELMVTDGCFILEILRTGTERVEDYALNDPIFSNHGKHHILPYIRRDMLRLENQLPIQVLNRLAAVENDSRKDEELINRLILTNYLSETSFYTSLCKWYPHDNNLVFSALTLYSNNAGRRIHQQSHRQLLRLPQQSH
ncbi:UPF0481 protein At3g47200-like [Eucalyptus grandis]|uniref:UPF0481 protein At3g47200-like n=1 Tax=Eucalyptus grandis TaxID=71139 RepID=UPI00192E9FF2|nr:UPF0481 protein At3g47200-like [Eucalyptus grandis]